ncbi:MAG: DUF4054 domain-containing protein [Spirochaetaceae bacterium]|jgi:hypothetical protein|nr:DUF4054 domain-containing protein [Spirochaetaceae bacterium]
MALSPRQIIAAICPELSGSPSLPVFLEMAAEVTDKGFYGTMYHYAVAYRACHQFTVAGGGNSAEKTVMNMGGGAPVASMSEGGLAISFAQGGAADGSELGSTKYGKMLLGLRKSRPTMGVNTGGLCL